MNYSLLKQIITQIRLVSRQEPAISKHLRVLEEAELSLERKGQPSELDWSSLPTVKSIPV